MRAGLHAIMHPMFYLQRGEVPHKRHTQFRRPDGGLFAEELFGIEGFSGRASLLYHHTPPTQTHAVEKVRDVSLEQSPDEAGGAHRHRLVNTKDLEPSGDGITGRVPLFYNSDVTFGVVLPADGMDRYYRNGEADEMYFVHTGTGTLETIFGPIDYGPGDYLVLPIGTTVPARPSSGDQRMLWVESPSAIVPPKRYRNDFGHLLSTRRSASGISDPRRDGREPRRGRPRDRGQDAHGADHGLPLSPHPVRTWWLGRTPVAVRLRHQATQSRSPARPPATARPPDVQAAQLRDLQARPRKFDYHPLAIPAPYNHSNINLDEVILRRRQLHVAPRHGHPLLHDPSSELAFPTGRILGRSRHRSARRRPEELAVIDRHVHPLHLTRRASKLEDDRYPYSWIPPDDAGERAEDCSDRSTGGVPGLTGQTARSGASVWVARARSLVKSTRELSSIRESPSLAQDLRSRRSAHTLQLEVQALRLPLPRRAP